MAQVGWSVLRIDFVARIPAPYLASTVLASLRHWSSTHFPSIGTVRVVPAGLLTETGARSTSFPAPVTRVPDGVVHDEAALVVIVDRSGQMHGDRRFGEHRHLGLDATGP